MIWSQYKIILNYGFHLKCFIYLSYNSGYAPQPGEPPKMSASSCMSTTYHARNLSDMVPHHTYCGNFTVGYASYSQQRKSLGTKEPQETSMQ